MIIQRYLVVIQYGAGHVHIRSTHPTKEDAEKMLAGCHDIRMPAKTPGKKLGAAPRFYIYEKVEEKGA